MIKLNVKVDFEYVKETASGIIMERERFWKNLKPSDFGTLLGYLLVLAILPFIGTLLLSLVFGYRIPFFGTITLPLSLALAAAVKAYVLAVISPFIGGFVMNIVAEALKYPSSSEKYITLTVYAATPAIISQFLVFVPFIGGVIIFLASIFSLYLIWLGLREFIKLDSSQALILLIVYFIVLLIVSAIAGNIGMFYTM